MKRIIAAAAACLIIVSVFASCSDPLSDSKSSSNTSSSSSSKKTSSSSKPKVAKTYADSFEDLRTYMKDKGYLTADMIKNANSTKIPDVDGADYKYGYEYIGAEKGEKYSNNGVIIELYSFKEGKQNDYIDSVKKSGKFELFDKEITAYLTDNDKYMMIYSDKNVKEDDTESDAYKLMQRTVKDFKAFKPTKTTEKSTESSKTSEKSKTTKSSESSKTSKTAKTSE